jgi:hypothetical protein
MPRQRHPPPPPAPLPVHQRFLAWWRPLKIEVKVAILSLVFVVLTFLATIMLVPEVRYALGFEKRPEERSSAPEPVAPPKPQDKEPDKDKSKQEQEVPAAPKAPKLKLIPLPNADQPKEKPSLFVRKPDLPASRLLSEKERGSYIGLLTQKPLDMPGPSITVMSDEESSKLLLSSSPGIYERGGNVNAAEREREYTLAGSVVMSLIIDQGRVVKATPLGGDKKFFAAATEAVRKWRYQLYAVNGKPVQIWTFIDVQVFEEQQ